MKNLKTHMVVWNQVDVRLTTQGDEDDRLYRHTHQNSAGCAFTRVKNGSLAVRTAHLAEVIKELESTGMSSFKISTRLSELAEYANLPT